MAFMYRAEEHEAELARGAFGPTVAEVVFYDPDFPQDGEPWLAIGYDADGNEIGRWDSNQEDLPSSDGMNIFDVQAGRGETVKFWLSI